MQSTPPQVERAIQQPYEFRFSDYISEGFNIIKSDPGKFVVFALLFFTFTAISQFVPAIGPLASSLIISPCLTAGLYLVAHKAMDGKSFEFNEFFRGFDFIGPLIVLTLLQFVLFFVAAIPLIVGAGVTIGVAGFASGGGPEIGLLAILVVLFCMIPFIYLAISWVFAPFLVIFHKMEAWQAMEASRKIVSQQWFTFLAFAIVTGIIGACGFLLLGVGALFTIPAAMVMSFVAFRDVVGLPNEGEGTNEIDHFLVD